LLAKEISLTSRLKVHDALTHITSSCFIILNAFEEFAVKSTYDVILYLTPNIYGHDNCKYQIVTEIYSASVA